MWYKSLYLVIRCHIQAVHRRASAVKDDLQLDVNNVGRWFKDNRLTDDFHNVTQ